MTLGIEINGIKFQYPSREVLRGVSFEAGPGKFVAVLGPNGSGKTTLLRAVSGYLKPSAGSVLLEGSDLNELKPASIARKVAVVTQSPAFDFPFSVLEYVLLGRSPHISRFGKETSHDYEAARSAIAAVGLNAMAENPVTQLSGGEQRRAALARALAQEPRVLLLDEPTSNLDINYQVSVMALLRTLAREKHISVVAVLHDINLATAYCDSIVLMAQGRVHSAGEPGDVITVRAVGEVYGSEVSVTRSPVTGRPLVLPVAPVHVVHKGIDPSPSVFVIGGGGSAASLLEALVSRGVYVQAGVLNVGDADWLVCRRLGVPVVEEEPFCPLSRAALDRALGLARQSDTLVITGVPFGSGNLGNLEMALDLASLGKRTLIVSPEDIATRDYTLGRATTLMDSILSAGATAVCSDTEVIKNLYERRDIDG